MADKQLFLMSKVLEELRQEIITKKKEYYELAKQMPLKIMPNYIFLNKSGNDVALSDLFGSKEELIVIHNMGMKCPYCTMWADGFNGLLPHIESRAAFVVTSPDEPELMNDFAHDRKWVFNMASTCNNTFKEDLCFQNDDGTFIPGLSTFRKEANGEIIITASTFFGEGDDFCPVWYFFDLLYNKDDNWHPKLSYFKPE